MATIRIVGEILNIQQLSRYDDSDARLISSQTISEDFGDPEDYIEFVVFDAGGNLLNIDYNYKNFKSPNTSFVEPNGTLSVIEIDPILDLQNLGYTSGEFVPQYNFFTNKISDSVTAGLFLKEISTDRTEIRVGSTVLSNEEIENSVNSLISESSGSTYFVDYILNFGNNTQVTAVNIALNRETEGYEILFKLYQPLPEDIIEKSSLWVVREKVNSYTFSINLDKLIIPDPGPKLRGPNFDIEIPNQNNIASSYQSYSNLISSLQNVSSSYQQLLSLITSQSIDINIDYTDFNNFVFFSSAKQRVTKFFEKVKQIEDAQYNITNIYTPITSSNPTAIRDYNLATASINNTIANFDGFEYYLYFESGSTLTSSVDFSITPYPKSGSLKPFKLWPTSSISASAWYNYALISAEKYDDYNQNNLIYTLPEFIIDDTNNASYVTFVNMIGHYFDNIWVYLQSVTDVNLTNNNLEKGVSKDLVYTALQSLGAKLYNKYGDSSDDLFLIGKDSGSVNFDNNFTPTGSYLNNIPRKDLLAETYKRIYHNLPLLFKTKGTAYGLQTLISTFGITSSILNVKEYGGDLKSQKLEEYNTDKVRIVTSSLVTGSVLSPYINLVQYPTSSTEFRSNDLNYVDISFSPETQIDTYASTSIAIAEPNWNLDDIIGNPGYLLSSSYTELDIDRNTYYNFTASYMDYAGFIRLIQFFDNSLFKMLKDYIPARTSLSTGITINSPVLERNKFVYSNPSSTSKIEVNEGTIEGPTIGTEYTNIYQNLTGSKAAYYTGEFEGDIVDYSDIFDEVNFNPYLEYNTSSWNSSHPNNPINLNSFAHSDFNILFNNISSSRLSDNRKSLEAIYKINSPLSLAGYSASYYAELQDSYETLKTHQLSRYEGTKISSLKYNNYSTASSTYSGDISFGKEPTINKNTRKIGLFTEIVSSSFLPNRNRVSLKYLVDEFGGLTELNQRNKHWEEVQRTFVVGDYLNISQFDNQKYSNQKTTDGDKLIYDSGYTYYPIIYFGPCSGSTNTDPKIYFENLGESNSYLVTADNGTGNRYISGSGTPSIPVDSSTGNIYNIFNNEIDPNNIFAPGTISSFPTYSAAESGDYKVEASFNLTVDMPQGGSSSFHFTLKKEGVVQNTQTQTITITNNATASSGYNYLYSPTLTGLTSSTYVTTKPVLIGITNYPAGTTFRKWNYTLLTGSYPPEPGCTFGSNVGPWYSTDTRVLWDSSNTVCTYFNEFDATIFGASPLYLIPGLEDPTSAQTVNFSISRPLSNPITNVPQGGKLTLEFSQSLLSTSNYTASLSLGSLTISSLAVATGYASTVCPYFYSSSITSSNRSLITLSSGLSNFYDKGYQFAPKPLTGSTNTLYSGSANYGDIDYPFSIKPYDIILTFLSDNTYVESRILSSSYSSSYLQLYLDNQMSDLYITNLQSGSYQRFLILKKVEDETNAHVFFRKRAGKTSYGFTIPSNIATDFLDNIDTITSQVKQKLLADQQGTTS